MTNVQISRAHTGEAMAAWESSCDAPSRMAWPLPADAEPCATPAHGGFSFIELLIVVTMIGILATGAMGLTRWETKRTDEIELQHALRQIRSAIDAYHEAVDAGLIESEPDERGYPPDLDALVEGVELIATGEDDEDETRRMKFLRRIPIDPMTGKAEWGLRSYQDRPDSRFWGRENVYDVYSKSERTAIDGSRYRDW